MTHASITSHADPAAVLASTNGRVLTLPELMQDLDWDSSVRRWLAYARCRLGRHGSAARRYQLQAGDCVHEAVRLTLEGRRRFESGTESDFFQFICDVIDSLVSHDAEKARRHPMVRTVSGESEQAQPGEISEERLSGSDNTELELLFRHDLTRFLEGLDADLARYARLRAEEVYSTAEDYACALNISISEVRNMDRRLRRRRKEWIKQQTPNRETATIPARDVTH